jgi:hypothetical protein
VFENEIYKSLGIKQNISYFLDLAFPFEGIQSFDCDLKQELNKRFWPEEREFTLWGL